VFLGLVVLNIVNPGMVLRGSESEFPKLSRRQRKALKREKKEAKKQRKTRKKMGFNRSHYEEYPMAGDRSAA
jgi:hypothetical protein